MSASWPSSVREVPRYECDTESCWEARAVAADEHGVLDVAAGLRGKAFEHAPTQGRLDAWVNALLACGATRRARSVLEEARRDVVRGDAAWASAVDRRLAALPSVAEHGLFPGPMSAELRAAYVAIAEGRSDAAAAAFVAAGETDPYHTIQAAGLAWARGEQAQARRLWARARVAYEERGAEFRLEAIDRKPSSEILWLGESLVRGEVMHDRGRAVASQDLRFLTADGGERRRLKFVRSSRKTVFIGDGQSLLRLEHDGILVYDAMTGLEVRTSLCGGGDRGFRGHGRG